MEASTDLFINIIRHHRIIYDTTSTDFKNIHKKEDEWVKIANESRMSVEAAKKRYFSLRQKYSREKKKEITCARSKQKFRPTVFFDRLSFLDDFIKPRRTYTNDVDGIDSTIYEDEFCNEDDQNDDSVSRLIGDENSHRSSIQRRPLNSVDNEEYTTLFGDEISLEEEAAMDQQLVDEMEQDSSIANESQIPQEDYEILDEVHFVITPQDVSTIQTAEGVQSNGSDIGASSVDIWESSNDFNETMRLRATLPEEEQELYERQPTNGFDPMGRLSHLAGERNLQPHLNVTSALPAVMQGLYQRQARIGFSSILANKNLAGGKNLQPNENDENGVTPSISILRRSLETQQSNYVSDNVRSVRAGMPIIPDRSIEIRRALQRAPSPNQNLTSTRKRPTSTVTSSSLSKNSVVVQAAVSARQHEKSSVQNQSSGKGGSSSMDAIKEKMESYLKACNDKLQKKPERSPHASFLSYLGTKMEKVPTERVASLEKEILDIVFRFSGEN